MKKFRIGGLMVAATLILGACTTNVAVEAPPATPTTVPTTPATGAGDIASPSADNDQVKTFDVEAGAYYFKPDTIRVKQGDRVKINLKAVDMQHNINVDELLIKSDTIKAGQSTTIEFTADQLGTFESYCSVGNHRQQGQVGKVIVED